MLTDAAVLIRSMISIVWWCKALLTFQVQSDCIGCAGLVLDTPHKPDTAGIFEANKDHLQATFRELEQEQAPFSAY